MKALSLAFSDQIWEVTTIQGLLSADWLARLSVPALVYAFILLQGTLEKSPSFCSSRPVTFPLFLKSQNPFFSYLKKKYFNSHITTPEPLSLYYFSGFITREVFMNNCFVNDTSWVKFNVKLYMEEKRGLRGGCRDRQKYRKENWNIFFLLEILEQAGCLGSYLCAYGLSCQVFPPWFLPNACSTSNQLLPGTNPTWNSSSSFAFWMYNPHI